jgi:hypothetical protein
MSIFFLKKISTLVMNVYKSYNSIVIIDFRDLKSFSTKYIHGKKELSVIGNLHNVTRPEKHSLNLQLSIPIR